MQERTQTSPLMHWGLATGISLIPLLPLGIWVGTHSIAFSVFFAIHLAVYLATMGVSLAFFRELLGECGPGCRIISIVAFVSVLVVIVAQASLPITARDALIHHLAVPKWWVQAGSITEIPWHEWSYYPMLLQLAFTGFLQWGADRVTPFYHGGYLVLLAGCIAWVLRTIRNEPAPALAAWCVIFGIPVCLKLASIPLVDLGLAYFCTLAFAFALLWIEQKASALMVGAAIGLALSTKFNAIPFCVAFFPFLFVAAQRRFNLGRALTGVLAAGIVAGVVYSPWLARNVALTGDPVYPLYKGVFLPKPPPSSLPAGPGGLSVLETRLLLHNENMLEVALLPLRVFVQGEDDDPARFDGRMTPFLLLAIGAFLIKPRRDFRLLLGGSSLFYLMLTLIMSDARVRYLAPIYGSLTILSVDALWGMAQSMSPRVYIRNSLAVPLILNFCWTVWYAKELLTQSQTVEYIFSDISDSEYLARNSDEYQLARLIDDHVPLDGKVDLVLTGNRFYFYNRAVESGGHSSANELIRMIYSARTAQELVLALKDRGFTHIAAHVARLRTSLQSTLPDEKKTLWNDFTAQHLRLRGNVPPDSVAGFALWEIH